MSAIITSRPTIRDPPYIAVLHLCTDENLKQKVYLEFIFKFTSPAAEAVMAEWLRRQTRNLMGYSRTGSNPVHSEVMFCSL